MCGRILQILVLQFWNVVAVTYRTALHFFQCLHHPLPSILFSFFECFINITSLFLLLVTLVHPVDHKYVAKGTIIKRKVVHGVPIAKEEVAVNVTSIIGGFDQLMHPI